MTGHTTFSAPLNSESANLVSIAFRAMDAYPPAVEGNRLNMLLFGEAKPIRSAGDYLRALDEPALSEELREFFIGDVGDWPFPAIKMGNRPDPWLVSDLLFNDLSWARELLPTQRDVGRILYDMAQQVDPEIIALMVVDGLSYYDLPETAEMQPCLVDCATLTELGYREVIGKPSVSQRLFTLGYRQQMGFTYFDVENNPLARDIYGVFGDTQIYHVGAFDDITKHIEASGISRGYVQIAAPGLDGLCHKHADRPPIRHYIDQILGRFDGLISCLQHGGKRVLACLTADHGILWRDTLGDRIIVPDNLLHEDTYSPRYIKGSLLRDYICTLSCNGQAYSLLRAPFLTRPLRRQEWGAHGGISAWESLVPLIIRSR